MYYAFFVPLSIVSDPFLHLTISTISSFLSQEYKHNCRFCIVEIIAYKKVFILRGIFSSDITLKNGLSIMTDFFSVPPQMETTELQKFTRREDDSLTLWCPVKQSTDSTTITEIFWYKDGRPIDSSSAHNLRVCSSTLSLFSFSSS